MKWKVLVSAPYMQPEIERFRPVFAEHGIEVVLPPVTERLSEDELLRWIGDIDGVIAGDDRFTEKVLQAAPRLKVLSKWGTGIDSFDLDACRRRNVAVRNTPNAFSEPVADSVLAYILSFARRTPWMDREMKQGHWVKISGTSLCECTLGVIGVGNVGKAVARRAAAFGMRILGNDPVQVPQEFLEQHRVTMVSWEELLRQSDFVTINCDLNPTSRHLMNDAAFDLMKQQAVLVNTARGPIVDEAALVRALQQGKIAGAGLDVFETEPLPPESPLRHMAQALLAPHNSNSSKAAWERVHENSIRNLLEVLKESES
ncbi:phosphoglycerate dehydrogenase [Citrifermentans bremense]|uniref:phosphoglycerate dehydrogenase n=1 Tax=Citrifermentans bremense TaxID=60035 RepID=UPI0004186A85|nr:phosphoglycerate dehydrogenase [Citrifermentans bremense]